MLGRGGVERQDGEQRCAGIELRGKELNKCEASACVDVARAGCRGEQERNRGVVEGDLKLSNPWNGCRGPGKPSAAPAPSSEMPAKGLTPVLFLLLLLLLLLQLLLLLFVLLLALLLLILLLVPVILLVELVGVTAPAVVSRNLLRQLDGGIEVDARGASCLGPGPCCGGWASLGATEPHRAIFRNPMCGRRWACACS